MDSIRPRRRWLLLMLVTLCVSACSNLTTAPASTPAPSGMSLPATELAIVSSPVSEAATAAPVPGGDMLVAVGESGIRVLTKDGWAVPEINNQYACTSDIESFYGHRAFFDDQGYAWIECRGTRLPPYMRSIDGKTWIPGLYASGRGPSLPVVSQNHHIYDRFRDSSAFQEAYIRYSQDRVTPIGRPEDFGGHVPITDQVAFAPDGTGVLVDVFSDNPTIYRYNGQRWSGVGIPKSFDISSLDKVFMTSKGDVLLRGRDELFKLDGDMLVPVVTKQQFLQALQIPPERLSPERLTFATNDFAETPDGRIWLATDAGLFGWDGIRLILYDLASGLPASRVNDLDVDAGGHLWAATDYGLAVLRGDRWEMAVLSTSDLPDSQIHKIVVKGQPALPPAGDTPKTATVSGMAVFNDEVAANTTIMLCIEDPRPYNARGASDDLSCAYQMYHQEVQTDAQGTFVFEHVPIGRYIAICADPVKGKGFIVQVEIAAITPGEQEMVQLKPYDPSAP